MVDQSFCPRQTASVRSFAKEFFHHASDHDAVSCGFTQNRTFELDPGSEIFTINSSTQQNCVEKT